MTELLTAAQMRAIEQEAIESGQATGLDLMEKAGRGIFEAILEGLFIRCVCFLVFHFFPKPNLFSHDRFFPTKP